MGDGLKDLWGVVAGLRARRKGANAGELQGRHVSTEAPDDKDLWIWNADDEKWEPSGSAQVLFSRCTQNLTLTTSAQSIVGDGDSSKVRLLLPTIGDWTVETTVSFTRGATSPGLCQAYLHVNDSGTKEDGDARWRADADVEEACVSQRWKVTTTAVNTPVELKANMSSGGGNATLRTEHTTLSASIGAGGGSVAAASDHGSLSGLGDVADHAWALLLDGSRAGSTGTAQDFGSNGIKADVLAESTGAAGITADGVLLKDGQVGPLASNKAIIFGAGSDASIYWDGSNLLIAGTSGQVFVVRDLACQANISTPGHIYLTGNSSTFDFTGATATGLIRLQSATVITLSGGAGAQARPPAERTVVIAGDLTITGNTGDNLSYIRDHGGYIHFQMDQGGGSPVTTLGQVVAMAQAVTMSTTLGVSGNTTLARLGVGGATLAGVGLYVYQGALGGGTAPGMTGIQILQTEDLAGNKAARRGIRLFGTFDIAGFNLGTYSGIEFAGSVQDTATGGTITTLQAVQAQQRFNNAIPNITTAYTIRAAAPSLPTGAGVVALTYGLAIENQGHARATTAYGLHIAAQSGATSATYGIYVANATDYSLFIDAGLARFDGDGTDVFELPADVTDPTGGGGAATGRIPVKIGGATVYLAYY